MYAQHLDDGSWRELAGNVVFSPNVFQSAESLSDEQRKEFNCYLIVDAPRPELSNTQRFGAPIFTIKGDTVERTYEVVELSAEEIEQRTADQAESIRSDRAQRLADCDWTQLSDAPLTEEQKTAWAAYRQALRDIPQQAGFPWEVVWPTQPE